MDFAERRTSYVWTILVLSWPAAFFACFLAFVGGMIFSSDKHGDDLEKIKLANGTKSEEIVSGNITILKVTRADDICFLTFKNGKIWASSCHK